MSRYHISITTEIEHLMTDVKTLSADELRSLHSIEINEDGSVYDTISFQTHKSALDWANAVVEDMENEYDDFESDKYSDNDHFYD